MEHWRFESGQQSSQWSWTCINDETESAVRSNQTFPTLSECLQDAVANGYAD